ncbi:MAG: hypothetical protein MJY87_02660 [Fibrobacter sp.]|nr:hypothetical protein [Fibrobacter sp.]
MKSFVCVLFLMLCTFAFAKDFSAFEKSLFEQSPIASSEDSVTKENESSNSFSDFEKSLMEMSSELSAAYTLRENLLEALQKKDTKKVSQIADQLEALESRSVMPIQPFESECVFVELNMLDRLTDFMVKYYRTVVDTGRFDSNVQVPINDGLYFHVTMVLESRDSTKMFYSYLSPRIEHSKLPDVKRRKLEILALLRDAYRDTKTGELVHSKTADFVEKYPNDPDAPWMKHSILGPLSRMSVLDFKMDKRSELKEDVIRDKLYSGGLGFNFYLAMGGFGIGFDDLYRNDIYEPDPMPVNWEFYLQFGHFTALLEMVNSGVSGISSFGWGLGWVVYDSRYLKVRPYFGAETSFMNYRYKDNYVVGGTSYSSAGSSESVGLDEEGFRGILGVNIDFKFITAYFLTSSSKLSSFSVVGKFGVSTTDIDTDVAKGEGYEAFFALGLGIYLW